MDRRMFLKYLSIWGKRAALAGLLPAAFFTCGGRNRELAQKAVQKAGALSLRDIAAQKVHHGPDGFLNPFSDENYGNMSRVLSWKLFSHNEFKQYYKDEKTIPVSADWSAVNRHDDLSITFIKHASILIRDRGVVFLIDPIFGHIYPFIKDFSPLTFKPEDIPAPDHILITHGHYDHLDVDSLAHFPGAHVISPMGYDKVLDGSDLRRTKLDWFQSFKDGEREVVLVPANHWTMRGVISGPNSSLWGSFIIKTASGPTIYIAGDTGFFNGFEEIGREYNIDLAVFNLGAYEPRWFMKKSHINPEEVVTAFKQLKAKKLMIVHWGSFRLGDEPVHFPPLDMKKQMQEAGLADALIDLPHGRTLFYNQGVVVEPV